MRLAAPLAAGLAAVMMRGAVGVMVRPRRRFAVMPERHANTRADRGYPLERDSQGENECDQQAGQTFPHRPGV